jgi:hypothetical protein
MRIDELLSEGRVPELELIPDTGNTKVVMFKGRRLVITGGRRISTRLADFSIGAWYFSMDGGAQLPCWVTGSGSATCGLTS